MRAAGHLPTIGAIPARSADIVRPSLPRLPLPTLLARILLAVALMVVAGAAGFLASEAVGTRALAERANSRLDVLIAEIDGIITSGSNLPSALVLNDDILGVLRSTAPPALVSSGANRFLESLNNHLGSLSCFVLDRDGSVRASSDWGLSENLIGRNLGYQPFFRMALNGSRYGYYAIDPARNEPGFYFSQPILDEKAGWQIVGVAVVKVSLNDLQRRWLAHESPVLAADRDGVVILSTVPEWRYTLLNPERADLLVSSRRFDGRTLRPFPLRLDGISGGIGRPILLPPGEEQPANLSGSNHYFAIGRQLPGAGWQLVFFADYSSIRRQSLTIGALTAVLCGALLLMLLYIAQRRRIGRLQLEAQRLLEAANQDLEAKIATRTSDLTAVNTRLRQEIAERIRAEETLRAAQDELVQAAKLAVLGRLAAGITHELAQPLGAMRTLAANAIAFMRRGDLTTAQSNLDIVAQQIDQMGRIIGPLKSFARKSPARREPVDIAQAVSAALFLFGKRISEEGVTLDNRCTPGATIACCDSNRLEQVLVNLIGNGLDEMKGGSDRRLTLSARQDGVHIIIDIHDSGPGIPAMARGHLFEPFFTTKPAGEGLGLGLAISRDIVRDFGGDLDADNHPAGGAVFSVTLPAAKESPCATN